MIRLHHRTLLLLLGMGLAACSPPEGPEGPAPQGGAAPPGTVSHAAARPNVLVVTFDTTRPDALGWVEGASPTASTPHLDRLAGEGFRFPRAAAPVPVTLPSHTSMFTGLIPRRHGVRDNGQMVPPTLPTLATVLQEAGYATAAVVSGFPLSRVFGLDRGFGHYDDHFPEGAGEQLERRAEATTAAAVAWLEGQRGPWFLWVHYYDPHDPYTPPEGFGGDSLRAAYDGEVSYADEAFGQLWRIAEGKGALLTVFAADHGESLGEHGENTHGFFVYESTLAVPLVFHGPGRVPAGESGAAARLVDLTPTLLDLLGMEPLREVDGVSLVPWLEGQRGVEAMPPAILESQRPWISYGWAPLMAVRADGWKWIEAPRPELYHLVEDPGERENLVESHRPRARELQGLLRAAISQPATAASTVEDPEVAARLQALGYTGAGTAPRGEAPPGLPDPKDRVRLWNLLGEGEARFSARDLAGAVALYDQVLAEEPENRYALGRSGIALTEMGELSKGVARLEAAVALDPRRPELREGLARTYARLGRFEAAAEQMAELTRLQPRRPEHWSRLGSLLGQSGRPADAAAALAQAAQLAPGDPAVQIRWGFAAFGAGDTETAILALQRGAALMNTPDAPGAFPHSGALGILLARSGRPEEARPWLARCRPHEPEFAEARLELARLAAAGGDRPTARRALAEALAMRPEWRSVAAQDPALAPLLQEY